MGRLPPHNAARSGSKPAIRTSLPMKARPTIGNTTRARVGPVEVPNKPGVFLSIPLSDLHIDTTYQRPLKASRLDAIANDWSWVACGCLTVALRGTGSGQYYVIDGQHRVEGARRANISELPCLVFDCMEPVAEAQSFLESNTGRLRVGILDRYRALLVTGDHIALKVQTLLAEAGRTVADGGGNPRREANQGFYIMCLDFLMRAVEQDEATFAKIWPLANQLCDGKLLTKELLSGLFYLERFLVNTSITERHWSRRLMQIGYDTLCKSITETKAYEGKSGSAICAQGILRALNKGLRNKLSFTVIAADSD